MVQRLTVVLQNASFAVGQHVNSRALVLQGPERTHELAKGNRSRVIELPILSYALENYNPNDLNRKNYLVRGGNRS